GRAETRGAKPRPEGPAPRDCAAADPRSVAYAVVAMRPRHERNRCRHPQPITRTTCAVARHYRSDVTVRSRRRATCVARRHARNRAFALGGDHRHSVAGGIAEAMARRSATHAAAAPFGLD